MIYQQQHLDNPSQFLDQAFEVSKSSKIYASVSRTKRSRYLNLLKSSYLYLGPSVPKISWLVVSNLSEISSEISWRHVTLVVLARV